MCGHSKELVLINALNLMLVMESKMRLSPFFLKAAIALSLMLVSNVTIAYAQGSQISKADLFPVAGSNISGVAVLEQMGDQVKVSVALIGGQHGSTFIGEIHKGTCDSIGEIRFRLGSATLAPDGAFRQTSTINTHLVSLLDGDHLVVIHNLHGAVVACGNIPSIHPKFHQPTDRIALPKTGGVPMIIAALLASLTLGAGVCIRRFGSFS